MKPLPLLLALAAATALAAAPAPWQPSSGMAGTFHAAVGDGLFRVETDGRCELSNQQDGFHCVGTLRPDPSGDPNRFIARLRRIPAPAAEDQPEIANAWFSYEPGARAWQMLAVDDGLCEPVLLEKDTALSANGAVEHDDTWFEWHFVPDLSQFDWTTIPDAARRHFIGVWKNQGDGATLTLAPDGTGFIGNNQSALAATCKWRIRRNAGGWTLTCEIQDLPAASASPDPYFAVFLAASQFRQLRLLSMNRHLALATLAAGETAPDAAIMVFDRVSGTIPANTPKNQENQDSP